MRDLIFILLSAVVCSSLAKEDPPNVQVYTRLKEEFGKDNILICHVTCFYPPLITIDLLKNGETIPKANQTDLAFANTWKYHLTKAVAITLSQEDKFVCRVTHMGKTNDHILDLD
ncbi:beta-2-microglobulin-like isoform X2 [Hippoglossus hippoglossus]|uniref:beta-2-microglobulin-like isoform X2 n=1 Tax=Hippoglossus hippoglossus TaxID=8267 RepID=UPI00148BA8C4|nr:beta-2-microglobulin-like isoform X2 [Hippoglossus hippoglossus]